MPSYNTINLIKNYHKKNSKIWWFTKNYLKILPIHNIPILQFSKIKELHFFILTFVHTILTDEVRLCNKNVCQMHSSAGNGSKNKDLNFI